MVDLGKRFDEQQEVESLAELARPLGTVRVEHEVTVKKVTLPIYSFSFGSPKPEDPTLIIAAGVHGLERIGTRVVLAYLKSFCKLISWDTTFQKALQRCRVRFYPIVNPGGMYLSQRSNPNNVDLMRNAPVESASTKNWKLIGGHRLSPRLPWYRGPLGAPMEDEAQALCGFVQREVAHSKFAISLDVHSGFGAVDRLWFPFARSRDPFPKLAEVYALKQLLDQTYPNHIYCVEPQSQQYTAHGDLWDYLYDWYETLENKSCYLPLSLELGSWIWIKKNPRQLFSILGVFNPVLPHRRSRAQRRHLVLFDFLFRSVISHRQWVCSGVKEREELQKEALHFWYKH